MLRVATGPGARSGRRTTRHANPATNRNYVRLVPLPDIAALVERAVGPGEPAKSPPESGSSSGRYSNETVVNSWRCSCPVVENICSARYCSSSGRPSSPGAAFNAAVVIRRFVPFVFRGNKQRPPLGSGDRHQRRVRCRAVKRVRPVSVVLLPSPPARLAVLQPVAEPRRIAPGDIEYRHVILARWPCRRYGVGIVP